MAHLCNATTGEVLATNVRYAQGLIERLAGFIPKSAIAPDEGLWFEDCRVIHTIGMRSKIDVIFLDSDGCVVRVHNAVAQNRPLIACLKAKSVVELGTGALDGRDILPGDRLILRAA